MTRTALWNRSNLRAGAAALAVPIGLILATGGAGTSSARFAATTANASNSFAGDTPAAPSNLTVTQTCSGGSSSTITFVAATSAVGTAGSLVLTKPAGVTTDDVLVAQLAVRAEAAVPTAPTGWVLLDTQTRVGAASTHYVFYKVAGPTEAATYTFNANMSARTSGGVVAYRNVSTTNPIDSFAGDAGTGTPAIAPGVTTTMSGARLLVFFALRQGTPGTDPTMTARWALNSGGGAGSIGVSGADEVLGAAGPTGTRSATGGIDWPVTTLALRPIGSGGTPSASIGWTASPSSYATGYTVERYVGATLQSMTAVTPIAATGTTQGPLSNGVTYTFKVNAYYLNWRSPVLSQNLSTSCP